MAQPFEFPGNNHMNETATRTEPRKPQRLYFLTGFLLLILAFVAVTFFVLARASQQEQIWVRMATDVQVSSQQLSKSAGEAASGNLDAFKELEASHARIRRSMQTLGAGSVSKDVSPVPGKVRGKYDQLQATWQRVDENTQRILERESLLAEMTEASSRFSQSVPELQESAEQAVDALVSANAPQQQVAAASRQPAQAERMLRQVSEILRGGTASINASKALHGEIQTFDTNLQALLRGNQSLGISPVRNQQALTALNQVAGGFEQARGQLQVVLDSSAALFEVRGAADEIFLDSSVLFARAEALSAAVTDLPNERTWPSIIAGVAGLGLLFVIVALLIRSVIVEERKRASRATNRDRQNQEAIDSLLQELSSLAEGDLTVQATVGEEITQDIAQSINYAVQRLREIVTGINQTAHAVANNAESTRTAAATLAEAAAQQAEQVDSATEEVNNMAKAFDSMSSRSRNSSDVAHQSVEIANNGAEKVRETIAGMDLIRDQIQETSKRIKRLGESSQEIGTIVGLINGIAEQTNILALNAAIQAASAGGAGKGFAMVADEVQELAESATQATRRIESLVQTIQADTAEAVHSMEDTTAEVVRGANLAEDAGQALQKIEAVSSDLSNLIQDIASEAQSQTSATTRIANLMKAVRDVSIRNSNTSKTTAETIEELAELVMHLSESVSDFKLPASGAEEQES
jgi:twitching motility protein PilJ